MQLLKEVLRLLLEVSLEVTTQLGKSTLHEDASRRAILLLRREDSAREPSPLILVEFKAEDVDHRHLKNETDRWYTEQKILTGVRIGILWVCE